MITGYFYLDVEKKNGEIRQIKKIFKLILEANALYLLWDSFYAVLSRNMSFFDDTFTIENFLKFIVFNESALRGHLWYLGAILYVLIIVYIFDKLKIGKCLSFATSLLERFALVSLNANATRDYYISTTLLVITVFLFTLKCHGDNKTLALIGRKHSTWLYILHPIFITCIGVVARKMGVYGIYKVIAPIVVYITTLIFLMIVDKIKMAAVIDR